MKIGMNHTRRKHYIILAVKKDDPNDIYGFVEGSFSMSWQRGRVNLWTPPDDVDDDGKPFLGYPVRKNFQLLVERLQKGWSMSDRERLRQLKGKRTIIRKQMANHAHENFRPCGRTPAEYEWNWVKHYSMISGKNLRSHGYEIRPYRVGSKFCPVEIDFTERTAMEKKQLKWDKFKWRNPPYRIKQTTI